MGGDVCWVEDLSVAAADHPKLIDFDAGPSELSNPVVVVVHGPDEAVRIEGDAIGRGERESTSKSLDEGSCTAELLYPLVAAVSYPNISGGIRGDTVGSVE